MKFKNKYLTFWTAMSAFSAVQNIYEFNEFIIIIIWIWSFILYFKTTPFIPLFKGELLQVLKFNNSSKNILQHLLQNTVFPLEKGVRGLFSTSLKFQNYKNNYPYRRIWFIIIECKANVLDGCAFNDNPLFGDK